MQSLLFLGPRTSLLATGRGPIVEDDVQAWAGIVLDEPTQEPYEGVAIITADGLAWNLAAVHFQRGE